MAGPPYNKPPTYEELREMRAKEWASAQARAADNMRALLAAIARTPDAQNVPRADLPWGQEGIACPHCSSQGFTVVRWVLVNGRKHRAELKCLGCHISSTWDWNDNRWLLPSK